jgi:ABC-2 type transport system ATP-binding protein
LPYFSIVRLFSVDRNPPAMTAIAFAGVSKRRGSVLALDALDLAIEDGEVYALVGPNGSGKTTALNVLLGLVRPTEGQATVHGYDVWTEAPAARRHLGVVPEGTPVYERLSGRRHVDFGATSRGVDVDPEAVLDRVGLADVADRRAGTYSRGMTQRLVLALALVGEPDVLLLDEPFYGLDPDASATLRRVLRTERDRGATVVFASHLFDEVGRLADRVGMLSGGQLVREGAVADLVVDEPAIDALEDAYRDSVDAEVTA